MAAQLSYAPVAVFEPGQAEFIESAREFAGRLRDREIPACLIRRAAGGDLEPVGGIAKELTRLGILAVVELHLNDPSPPIRNLVEHCVLGCIDLKWQDGKPAFDLEKLIEILNGTGRFRLPLDLSLRFEGRIPDATQFGKFVDEAGYFTRKYAHVQVVKLAALPSGDEEPAMTDKAGEYLASFMQKCPRSMAALASSLWVNRSSLRSVTGDLGLMAIEVEESSGEAFRSSSLKAAEYVARQLGMAVVARLPLTPRSYRKGWYTFEVGKVFDSWVDRRAYNAYRDRPGWLED